MAIGRARFSDVAFAAALGGSQVTRIGNPVVKLYKAGTGTPGTDDGVALADTIYRTATGGTTYGNPFTGDAYGNFEFFLDKPQRLKIVATGTVSGTTYTLVADYVPAEEDPTAVTELMRPARYYGIKADFSTNDSPHIQDAIDDAANAAVVGGHGLAKVTLDAVGLGKCLLSDTLILRKGVWLSGPGVLDDNTNLDGGAFAQFPLQLYWAGTAGQPMIWMRSDTPSAVLTGARVSGLYIDGLDSAGSGILMSSTQYCRVDDVYVATCRNYGVRLDDFNGQISKHNRIGKVKWFAGTPGAHCDNAIGLILEGAALWGVTLNLIENMSGSRINGSTIYLGWADNNTFIKHHSTPVGGGTTGKGLVINSNSGIDPDPSSPTYTLPTTKAAGGNTFFNVMDKVTHVNLGSGNTIVSYTSEGGGIDDPGGKLRVLSIEDYITGDSYRTHQYKTQGKLSFSPGDLMSPDASASRVALAGTLDAWRLQNGASQIIAGVKEPDNEWGPGTIKSVRVYGAMDASNTGTKNVQLQLQVGSQAPGAPGSGAAITYTYDSTAVNKQVDNGTATLFYTDFTGLSVAHARGGDVSVWLKRLGAAGGDDASGDLYIRQIQVWFVGSGPDSAGSGTYTLG